MKDHFYVTLFGNASQDLYEDSKIDAFTVRLAQPIDLRGKHEWEVALVEFSCPPLKTGTFNSVAVVGETSVLIYCNLIAPQFVGNALVRCLRTFVHPSAYCLFNFENPYYLPVERRSFQDIRIELLTSEGKRMRLPERDSAKPVKLVLHFRRVRD